MKQVSAILKAIYQSIAHVISFHKIKLHFQSEILVKWYSKNNESVRRVIAHDYPRPIIHQGPNYPILFSCQFKLR